MSISVPIVTVTTLKAKEVNVYLFLGNLFLNALTSSNQINKVDSYYKIVQNLSIADTDYPQMNIYLEIINTYMRKYTAFTDEYYFGFLQEKYPQSESDKINISNCRKRIVEIFYNNLYKSTDKELELFIKLFQTLKNVNFISKIRDIIKKNPNLVDIVFDKITKLFDSCGNQIDGLDINLNNDNNITENTFFSMNYRRYTNYVFSTPLLGKFIFETLNIPFFAQANNDIFDCNGKIKDPEKEEM